MKASCCPGWAGSVKGLDLGDENGARSGVGHATYDKRGTVRQDERSPAGITCKGEGRLPTVKGRYPFRINPSL